jgi:hypothetical protein
LVLRKTVIKIQIIQKARMAAITSFFQVLIFFFLFLFCAGSSLLILHHFQCLLDQFNLFFNFGQVSWFYQLKNLFPQSGLFSPKKINKVLILKNPLSVTKQRNQNKGPLIFGENEC